jgi:hypothetical protein
VWALDWKLGLPANADKLSRINTVVAVSAYVAAILAAVFALIAYWQASGHPSLSPAIIFPGQDINDPLFGVEGRSLPHWVHLNAPPFSTHELSLNSGDPLLSLTNHGAPLVGAVYLDNKTKYSARNPGMRIEFVGLLFNALTPGWTPVERQDPTKNGYRSIQWDGGTDNIIHGHWMRSLPELNLSESIILSKDPALLVTVVADGCSPSRSWISLRLDIPTYPFKIDGPSCES